MAFGFGAGSSKGASIPSSPAARDDQAINAIKASIKSPRNPTMPLIECEFPALQALNKLGDGSLRSVLEVEDANLSFVEKLLKSISPISFLGPKTWLLVGSAASNSLLRKSENTAKKCRSIVHSLKDGLPEVEKGDVCVLITPSTKRDYDDASRIASDGIAAAVILQNGFAKDAKSVPSSATMAYFLKPLTYNSQVAGYLIRQYPGKWTTIDAASKNVLGEFDDEDILVRKTNTPDLRESVRRVQKSADERAIKARIR